MQNPAELTNETHLFKTGNSWAFRILKNDKEFVGADETTRFEKTVSPDGKQIIFTKVEESSPDVMAIFDQEYAKHESLMERLKDL
ncbi:MAG: AbrB family transcriptional regulator [Lactobacillaceae bacterium]|jgi:hypothetical protein|nr:AbrB family transcriptional regulator [Lactobacillaceae bacterium]